MVRTSEVPMRSGGENSMSMEAPEEYKARRSSSLMDNTYTTHTGQFYIVSSSYTVMRSYYSAAGSLSAVEVGTKADILFFFFYFTAANCLCHSSAKRIMLLYNWIINEKGN